MSDKPSVTDLLDLLNKPALMKWANKIGLQGISLDAHRRKSKAEGTSLHRQIESFLKHGIPLEDPVANADLNDFMAGKEVIGLEGRFEHEHFIGRYDVKLKIDGKVWLCDFKSSSSVYLENVLQLTAYRMAEECDGIAVIEIPSFKFKPITVQNPKVAEGIVRALAYLFQAKNALQWEG